VAQQAPVLAESRSAGRYRNRNHFAFYFLSVSCSKQEKDLILAKKLYVGGLAYSTTEDTLQNLFTQAGEVSSVRIITDRDTGQGKGFGFVEMSNDSEASRAINLLNGTDLDGRNITVNEARDRPQRDNSGGNRYNRY